MKRKREGRIEERREGEKERRYEKRRGDVRKGM